MANNSKNVLPFSHSILHKHPNHWDQHTHLQKVGVKAVKVEMEEVVREEAWELHILD